MTRDDQGQTALHHAVLSQRDGRNETIRVLLRSVPVHKLSYLDMKDDNGMTALHLACKEGEHDCAMQLVNIPDIKINVVDVYGRTILHECVHRGWHDVIQRLIELGVNIHVRDIRGEIALELSDRRETTMRRGTTVECANILRRE